MTFNFPLLEVNCLKRLLAVSLVLLINSLSAQTIDPSFQAAITAKSEASGAILFDDGRYLVYGDFIRVNGTNKTGLVKFNADGTIDNTFNIGTGPNDDVQAAALQSDGKILLLGKFTSFNGVNRSTLIRLNADGSVDNTFTPSITLSNIGVDFNLAIQPDGGILITGPLAKIDDLPIGNSFIVRFNANGSKDNSFAVSANYTSISDIAVQADGKIIISGSFSKGIARLNSDGSTDVAFDVGTGFGDGGISDVVISPSNKIIVGGSFTQFNGVANQYLVSLTNTGAIDASYQANGKFNYLVTTLFQQQDGLLLVAGYFSQYGVSSASNIAKLNSNGSLVGTFNPGTGSNGGLSTITANTNGDILVSGNPLLFTSFNGSARNGLAILDANGSLKSMAQPVNLQKESGGVSIEAQGTGKFLLAHFGNELNGVPSTGFERLNSDGTIDGTFNGNSKPNDYVRAIAVDHNGQILIGGQFTKYNNISVGHFARLSSSGDIDNTFLSNIGSGFNGSVLSITEQPDGKILVGGNFTSVNGILRRGIARLNADGTPDASFNAANGFLTSTGITNILDVDVLSDGKILVAGAFDSFNNHSVKSLIRLNSDGSFDNTFLIGTGIYSSAGTFSEVRDVALLNNGKILAGGNFDNVNGAGIFNLAVLNSTGALDDSYKFFNIYSVEKIKRQENGKLIVVLGNGLIRLAPDGSQELNFTVGDIEHFAKDVTFIGNQIILTGELTRIQKEKVSGITDFILPTEIPSAPVSLSITSVSQHSISITWMHTGANETGFLIERSFGVNSGFTKFTQKEINSTSFNDYVLVAGKEYGYRVAAFNAMGYSAYSNVVYATTLPYPAPTDLVIESSTPTSVVLKWTDNSSNETGFEIYRSTLNNQSYNLIKTIGPNITTFTDVDVSLGTTYYYKVRSFTSLYNSFSDYSNEITTPPISPSNLIARAASANQITLGWTDNSNNETGFEIYRSASNNLSYALIQTTGTSITSFNDSGLSEGATYFYKIRAVNSGGSSPFSPEVSTIITALEEQSSETRLVVYPNPMQEELIIKNNADESIKCFIYNSVGRQIAVEIIDTKSKKIVHCSTWASGLYILTIPTQGISAKVFKE